ncbi:MAG: hypothetical protein HQL22_11005 [Candidatus Omnitrophica bacterium]|nr:hypothetical protein [Candidatus Omnitrophota bacterium]
MDHEIKSLDIGTMHVISASVSADCRIRFKKIRNAFLKIHVEQSMSQFLKQEELQYAEIGEDLYALGDSAFKMAGITGKDVSRPMQDGVLNPKEPRAEIILKLLIEALVGKAQGEGAICYYSIPAEPFQREKRVIYHSGIIHTILEDLGYKAVAVNEGLAVIYSGLADRHFTGIGISCGCGLINVCLSRKAQVLDAFAIDRAGDWIDDNASKAIGEPAHKVMLVKEGGLNLLSPQDRTENALAIYYKDLIQYVVECIKDRWHDSGRVSHFDGPVNIVCAGGTALPAGFIAILRSELKKARFPLRVDQVSLAKDPLYAIARGCLIGAVNDGSSHFIRQCAAHRRTACRPKKPSPAVKKPRSRPKARPRRIKRS